MGPTAPGSKVTTGRGIGFEVIFGLPVDKPENNVSMSRGDGFYTFHVPLNYPDVHKLGYADLIAASELSGLIRVTHNP